MDAQAHLAALAALYGPQKPDSQELARDLLSLAEVIHARLATLHNAPNAADAERLAVAFEGARFHMLRLAEAIRRECGR